MYKGIFESKTEYLSVLRKGKINMFMKELISLILLVLFMVAMLYATIVFSKKAQVRDEIKLEHRGNKWVFII